MKQDENSCYVLVNKDKELYTKEDYILGTCTVFFNTLEDAESELAYLLNTDKSFHEEDDWHVEKHRW